MITPLGASLLHVMFEGPTINSFALGLSLDVPF